MRAWDRLDGSLHADTFQPRGEIKALRGQVVLARDPQLAEDHNLLDPEIILKWIILGLEQLTQQKGMDAWRVLFSPDDRVVIKVNALGGPQIATSPQVAEAIAMGLQRAGIPPKQVLIWDRNTLELRKANYTIREDDGPLCFGTDRVGYESSPRIRGSIGSCFSPILTHWASALVLAPVLKDHDLSGVSVSIKNLFGVIHNPNKYHDSGCSPYLADLLASPEIQEKLRLIVCDAHRPQCQGGPAYVQKWSWPYSGILLGVDPVALDRVGAQILDDRRREVGLPSLEEAGRTPIHIEAASKQGLGEGNTEAIHLIKLGE
jgi:uncharacterized protein (DUF362 family)